MVWPWPPSTFGLSRIIWSICTCGSHHAQVFNFRYRHEAIIMNHGDPDPATCFPVGPPPTEVSRPRTSQHPIGQRRPTDPLRVSIVTAFCTCDMGAPQLSYMPRLPK
jgi:hypothetical protein